MGDPSLAGALQRLEQRLRGKGQRLIESQPSLAPACWPTVAGAAIFGQDLLSLHPDALGWGDDYSKLFSFPSPEQLEWLPGDSGMIRHGYFPLANLDGGNWILYVEDAPGPRIAIIDHEEVFDDERFSEAIAEGAATSLAEFIGYLSLQTVSCFLHLAERTRYSMIEIFDEARVVWDVDYGSADGETGEQTFADRAAAWQFYLDFARQEAARGYQIHYCPAYARADLDAIFR